jgi:hypothetical protein
MGRYGVNDVNRPDNFLQEDSTRTEVINHPFLSLLEHLILLLQPTVDRMRRALFVITDDTMQRIDVITDLSAAQRVLLA